MWPWWVMIPIENLTEDEEDEEAEEGEEDKDDYDDDEEDKSYIMMVKVILW